ncbi:MAG: glycosyltransferase family 4 protein [Cyanobacteria bacterium P01_G01_bin.19]
MKIAVIGIKGIPSEMGKIERYCQEFYPRIAEKGHQVDLFVQPSPNQRLWFSVDYYRNTRVIALAILFIKQPGFMLNAALSTVWASLGSYDVIHIQGTKAAWFSWFAQLFSKSKIVLTSHELNSHENCERGHKVLNCLSSWMERAAVKNADEVIVVSKALKKYFQRKYNIAPRYIPSAPRNYDSINMGFDYGKSLGLRSKRYILSLSKFNAKKRPEILIKAFQKLQLTGWKLVLAGEISDSLEYTAKLLYLTKRSPNIIFANQIDGQNLAEIIHHAALLVETSEGANLGLSTNVLEAMQQKVPVLASDRLIYRELIGRNRGLLFQEGCFDSLLRQLQFASSEPERLRNLAQAAHTYITVNHNWDRVTYGNLSSYLRVTDKINDQSFQHNA